jgi:hypothetical protein
MESLSLSSLCAGVNLANGGGDEWAFDLGAKRHQIAEKEWQMRAL